jgi:PhoH-like ATPase
VQRRAGEQKMKKTFVLDTNVLIHDPDSIYSFNDNNVVLPLTVIEELDGLKKFPDERGRNARRATRKLDNLRIKGNIARGVKTKEGGSIRVEMSVKAKLPIALVNKADNDILAMALGLKESGETVIFISKDINMRIKAEVLGLEVQDFEKSKVNIDELYKGWKEIEVEDKIIDEFHRQKKMPSPDKDIIPQQFVLLRSDSDPKKTALARYSPKEELLVKINHDSSSPWGLKPLNLEQSFAFEAILNEEIKLVTLVGIAGTGKTLLALACGLYLTFDREMYRRLLISRPVVPMGKDIGYLPGSKEEKLANWMGAFYDNLEFLVETSGKNFSKNPEGKKIPKKSSAIVEDLFSTGKLEMEALTYLRGRSIPSQFIIIDEAQNLTPLEVKTIVSRAGKDTKVIVTGDPYQIDNPYLDSSSNGLTYLAEKFKGQNIFAHVTLGKSERSDLAALAAELL